ncbi:MAG: RsiV family protein [Verrucomicrobiota bacterium]
MNSGQVLRGEITLRNSETPERFILSKTFEHRTLSSSSPFYIPRVGVKFESIVEFPSFGETSFFRKALNERIISECTSSSKEFNSGSLRENWDLISSGVSTFTRQYTYQEQWQVRLETESVASFAVWVAPDWGGCGNPTKWAGRNFCWREGNLNEIKLVDLFRSGTEWEEKIRRWCRADLRRRGLGRASQSLSPATSIDVFTLSPTGLQIYFNPYILGSGADGEFVVHIPFALLRKFLQEDGVAGSIWPLQKKEPRGA